MRLVFKAEWQQQGDERWFEVTANAFLYHMVRRMVFLQVQAGQDRLSLVDLQRGLDAQAPLIPGLAPPQGLVLAEVMYPSFDRENNLTIYAEGSAHPPAASGDDDRGQDIRP